MATRYAAFLRGINLGSRRASGAELAAAFTATEGIADATPFIASGNVVFEDGTRRRPPAITKAIEASIHDAFGWESKVYLRDAYEVAALAALEPFTAAQLEASKGKPQIVFLDEKLTKARAEKAFALCPEGDVMVAEGRELHWLPSAGLADTDLDQKTLDRALGTGTTRTANTVRRLYAKFFE